MLGFFFTTENIALKKNAWQLHPYIGGELRDSANASKAVDGQTSLMLDTNAQCLQITNI